MADKIQALVGNNPMIKSVMSNPEHMAKAQEMLRNPEMQKQIGGVISNPAVIKQASEVLSGLQKMNTIQAGGRKRKRRTRRRKRKRRRKSTKKRGRKRRGAGTKTFNQPCKRLYMGSECGPQLTCLKNLREDIIDPKTNKMATHTCQNKRHV